MTTNKNARRTLLAAIFVTSTIFLSCDDTLGIFASVAAETANSSNLTEALEASSPDFVVHLGAKYYAGIGKLWSKTDSGTQWAPHSVSGVSAAQPFAGSGAVVDIAGTDTLFVSFSDSGTGESLGVWSTPDGSTWTRRTLAASALFPPSGENLVNILAANDTVFAVTVNERTLTTDPALYSIYYLDAGTAGAFTATNIQDNSTMDAATSASYDPDSTTYILTAGDVILAGSSSVLNAITEPAAGGSDYSGSYAYNNGANDGVVISTRGGYLHFTADGGSTWTTAGPFLDSGDDAYSLSVPTIINNDILVVGTSTFPLSTNLPSYDGYLEFDVTCGFASGMTPTTDHSLISSAVDFDSSLTTRSVSSMPLSDPGDGTFKLFACTDSYGLWSNTYDGTTWGLWKRE